MRDLILSVSEQLTRGIELGTAGRLEGSYRSIVVCGMGGSSIAGEMLSMVHDRVIVHWDYDLPSGINAENLVVCVSWSGETEEVISAYEAARAQNYPTLVISKGGRLGVLAREHASPYIQLPSEDIPPRTAVGYMVGALFAALNLESHLPTSLDPAVWEVSARALATTIGSRIPMLYTSYPWRKLTGMWKMVYSETAKHQIFVNWFPSGAHTEIVGWEGPHQEQFAMLLIKNEPELPRYEKNFAALLAICREKGYTVHTIELSGNTLLEKVFNSYILALWTSYYVANNLGVDPRATALLDEFKKLKEQA